MTTATSDAKFITKDVTLHGQIVTLYSTNGSTWLSSPEQLTEVMTRLENTKISLLEGKVGESMTALKPTSPRFRPRLKPKDPDGSDTPVTFEVPTISKEVAESMDTAKQSAETIAAQHTPVVKRAVKVKPAEKKIEPPAKKMTKSSKPVPAKKIEKKKVVSKPTKKSAASKKKKN